MPKREQPDWAESCNRIVRTVNNVRNESSEAGSSFSVASVLAICVCLLFASLERPETVNVDHPLTSKELVTRYGTIVLKCTTYRPRQFAVRRSLIHRIMAKPSTLDEVANHLDSLSEKLRTCVDPDERRRLLREFRELLDKAESATLNELRNF